MRLIPGVSDIISILNDKDINIKRTGVFEITLCGRISGVTDNTGASFSLYNATTSQVISDLQFDLNKGVTTDMVFSNLERKLYVVDPGRYHHVSTFTLPDYKRINKVIVNEAFLNMLRREIIEFKLITPGKISLLVRTIKSEIGELAYSDYLELQSSKYKTMSDFVKMKARYLK